MEAGPKLDELIAVKVMGHRIQPAPPYSTDLNEAQKVAAKLKLFTRKRPEPLDLMKNRDGSWSMMHVTRYEVDYVSTGDTEAHAICLAALKAVSND